MTELEDRLRVDMRAESEQIEPGSIPALRLPPRVRTSGSPGRGGSRHWPASMTALAAAAAVIAVAAGSFLIAHAVAGSAPHRPATGGLPASGIPPYYAYAVPGNTYHRTVHGTQYSDSVNARYARIRATADGKVIATVSPPAPYNAFESFAGAADARTFVFAAQWYIHGKTGGDPSLYKRDQKTPLKFLILRITPDGHTHLSPLSLPAKLTEAQAPTLALSPDGAKLAVAYGGSGKPAVVQVITLATGQMRQWTSPPPAATPVLGGPGGWAADGQTLAFGQMFIQHNGTIRSAPTQMRLLSTAAPGSSLAAASKLVTLHGAGSFPWPFLTPDGTKLIGETGGRFRPGATTESGAIGVYSARTGALLGVTGRWQRHAPRIPIAGVHAAVVWSSSSGSRLIVEMPRGKLNQVGTLSAGRFTPLARVAVGPLLAAIGSGGYQTSGGYVGFAW